MSLLIESLSITRNRHNIQRERGRLRDCFNIIFWLVNKRACFWRSINRSALLIKWAFIFWWVAIYYRINFLFELSKSGYIVFSCLICLWNILYYLFLNENIFFLNYRLSLLCAILLFQHFRKSLSFIAWFLNSFLYSQYLFI